MDISPRRESIFSRVPALKICGLTRADQAQQLAACGVDALGVNFWPQSKRYVSPESAAPWLRELAGSIVRVAVCVNPTLSEAQRWLEDGLVDFVQFHGDESREFLAPLSAKNLPFWKAIGASSSLQLDELAQFGARAIVLDAPAPDLYGGTGHTFDWKIAAQFREKFPQLPLVLAGGITPANARAALEATRAHALDVASGAESSPGIKDFSKIQQLLDITHSFSPTP